MTTTTKTTKTIKLNPDKKMEQKKSKKQYDMVHDVWSKHLFKDLAFEQYGKNLERNTSQPYFMTLDTSELRS